MASIRARLVAKGWAYWTRLIIVIMACYFARPSLDNYLGLMRFRYWVHQTVANWNPLAKGGPSVTKLVVIGDDEYYRTELAGRKPLKRNYLARLVKALCDADARVIAIDVDLRVTNPSTDKIDTDYKDETTQLVKAVVSAAAHRHIILAKTITQDEGLYRLDPDSYDSYGLCTDLDRYGQWTREEKSPRMVPADTAGNIDCGYIALTEDRRLIPPSLQLESGGVVESFAIKAARAQAPELVPNGGEYFGSFVPKERFVPDTFSATTANECQSERFPRELRECMDAATGEDRDNRGGLARVRT